MQNTGRNPRETTGLTRLTASIYTGRFAPSPTGPLHLGSLFTALASYLDARHHGGLWLLRIDDIDTPRIQPGATAAILNCLERFGLFWDDVVDYQSQHLQEYQRALESLINQGEVYGCCCNRKQLSEIAGPYPGFCRDRQLPLNSDVSLRIRCTNAVLTVSDGLQGCLNHDICQDDGDFVIRRKDGLYAYQLAVVVDDHRQGITHVVRGYDLLDSTPRQMYLQQRLGLKSPAYSHVPIVVDGNGHKLSKQTQAEAIHLDRPQNTLLWVLELLNQHPPVTLKGASIREILDWAIAHWHIERLAGQSTVPLIS